MVNEVSFRVQSGVTSTQDLLLRIKTPSTLADHRIYAGDEVLSSRDVVYTSLNLPAGPILGKESGLVEVYGVLPAWEELSLIKYDDFEGRVYREKLLFEGRHLGGAKVSSFTAGWGEFRRDSDGLIIRDLSGFPLYDFTVAYRAVVLAGEVRIPDLSSFYYGGSSRFLIAPANELVSFKFSGDYGVEEIFGGWREDVLRGGAGNDTLQGFPEHRFGANAVDGGDELYGENGNDILIGGAGEDTLDGGEGHDTIYGDEIFEDTSSGYRDVINGGLGDDTLFGGGGGDIIRGGSDADWLYGGEGADELSGDGGDDEIHGGEGRDSLKGGAGEDWLYGESDDDELEGQAGDDVLEGGEGGDTLRGGDDNDHLYGDDYLTSGEDTLYGDDGNDHLSGGNGKDTLYGGVGDDTLFGGSYIPRDADEGGDVVAGDSERDTLTGGEGNDRFVFSLLSDRAKDVITDFGFDDLIVLDDYWRIPEIEPDFWLVPFGDGSDLRYQELQRYTTREFTEIYIGWDETPGYDLSIHLLGDFRGLHFWLSSDEGAIRLTGNLFTDHANTVAFDKLGDPGALSPEAAKANANALGGDDVVTLPAEVSTYRKFLPAVPHDGTAVFKFHGGSGGDTITGGAANDYIVGDPEGAAYRDTLYGREGQDYLFGGDGNDHLDGGADDDMLYGGKGGDTFQGGSGGFDVISGGDGPLGNSGNGPVDTAIDTVLYKTDSQAYGLETFQWWKLLTGGGDYKFDVKGLTPSGEDFTDRVMNDVEALKFGNKVLKDKAEQRLAFAGQVIEDTAVVVGVLSALGGFGPFAAASYTVGSFAPGVIRALGAEDKGRAIFVESAVGISSFLTGRIVKKAVGRIEDHTEIKIDWSKIFDKAGKPVGDLVKDWVPNPIEEFIASALKFLTSEEKVRSLANEVYDDFFGEGKEGSPAEDDADLQSATSSVIINTLQEFSDGLRQEQDDLLVEYGFDPQKLSVVQVQAQPIQWTEWLKDLIIPDSVISEKVIFPLTGLIESSLEKLHGAVVYGFNALDAIKVEGAKFEAESLTVTEGSAILDIDVDLDGKSDATITLKGDYTGQEFVVQPDGDGTKIRLKSDAFFGSPTAAADEIVGDGETNLIDGLGGNDTLFGHGAGDTLLGGSGSDALFGGAGADHLHGESGNDILNGGDQDLAFDPAASKVVRLYQATLARWPDDAGHESWTQKLLEGTPLTAIATGFVNSREFQATYGATGASDFVTLLYENVLERAPDAGGLTDWVSRLDGGQTRESVVLGFSESPEFQRNMAAEALVFSRAAKQADWSDDVFRLYQATLDRTPDTGGFASWTDQLASGRAFQDVVTGFVQSPEFQQTYGETSNDDFITLLYRNVLDRDPDAGGQAHWQGKLSAGWTRERVVEGFSQSTEFSRSTAPDLNVWMKDSARDDVLDGGPGHDILFGGLFADTFVFGLNDGGRDAVAGLEAWDTILLEGFDFATRAEAAAAFTQQGRDAVLDHANGQIRLVGVRADQLTEDQFVLG